MKRKRTFIVIGLLVILISLFITDPVFNQIVKYYNQEVQYEWRIFNNLFCYLKTAGHCYTNEVNRTNAEIELYRRLLDNYNGQENIEKKLSQVVKSSYRFERTYTDLTNSQTVKMDSLLKYKDQIFAPIVLK
ncbi:hypothetical protein [Adhaeribacter soli]|uniref:Uncharacterized protein n=1 Tax=Adhaeribacter soli TaxID=2607655 RepID=A0A5N1IMZ5_9BACT|nr:hypothetical protein [Adhaeribacter soli]KAA9331227.1 hypothetical protein F0P94_15180 [Adhaeribacter soli]